MSKTGDGENLGTAEGAVLGRAAHTIHTSDPVLNDTWAIELLGQPSREQAEASDFFEAGERDAGFDSRPVLALGIGSLRYAEDEVERCVERGFDQYVILGAGFDTFALRRNDMAGRVRVFEVDHPDVQALKRERIERARIEPAARPEAIPCDFETSSLADALAESAYDPAKPAVFSWMNTLPYLTSEATIATLEVLAANSRAGSRLVLNYSSNAPLKPEQITYLQTLSARVMEGGEPMRSRWDSNEFVAALEKSGWQVIEHIDEAELTRRYFANRTDGFKPGVPGTLVTAERKPG